MSQKMIRLPLPFLCAALFSVLAFCPAAHAASPSAPAYRTMSAVSYYPWTDGLGVKLLPDEKLCRSKYGDKWKVKCAASFGSPGDTVEGVSMVPPLKGHWQWVEPARMAFRPAPGTPIPASTPFTIDISGMHCPSSTVLDTKKLTLTTGRLSVRLVESRFWPDPSPAAQHRLSASFEFNYPVLGPDPAISCIAPADMQLGPAELIWNSARDRVNVSFPVKRLPERSAEVSILVEGMPAYTYDKGKLSFSRLGEKEKGAVFRTMVTGKRSLFAVNSASLSQELDDELDRICVLTLESSLYATPGEVLKNLDIWQLPKFATPEARRPCDWQAAPVIPGSILSAAKKLTPVSLMKDDAATSRLRFRVPVEPGHYILAGMNENFTSASGHRLGRTWRQIMKAWDISPTVDLLQPGSVLALSGRKMLDIHATGLDSVRWEVRQIREPFLALLAQGSDDSFRAPLSNMGLDLDALSENSRGEIALQASAAGQAQFAALDLAPVLSRAENDLHGLMHIQLTGMKQGEACAFAERMILVTDIGLMVKKTALGAYEAFVHSFKDGRPVAGAKVSILGANGKPCTSGMSDDRGHVSLPSLNGLSRGSRPVAAVAEYGEGAHTDLAWLPLEDSSRVLDYSEFPVSGKVSAPDGLSAFVFSQRGMFRPGETLHFGCAVRRADWTPLPADMPLSAELRDPAGRIVMKRTFTPGKDGIAVLDWTSPVTAPSGRYTLDVRASGSRFMLGSASVRLEEFQPDTLELKIRKPAAKGWAVVDARVPLSVDLHLRNLYGTAAAGHKVGVSVSASPASFRFAGLEKYTFLDPAPFAGQGQTRRLPDASTDAEGHVSVMLPYELLSAASALCRISAEGFEADGGRATVTEISFLTSPHKRMVGYAPVGSLTNLSFIPQGSRAELEFIAVDPQLQRIPLDGLTFDVALRRYASSLVSDSSGNFRYDETPLDVPFSSHKLSLGAEGLRFDLPADEAGEYLLTVRDSSGILLASVPYAVAGEKLAAPGTELASGKMRLRLDKASYAAGDTISLALSLPYDGTGLITLEREGVAAFSWFTAKAGDTVQSIAIPKDFEGRGYVNVSFVRASDSRALYMEPHVYAAAPFSANIVQRDLRLELDAPEAAQPGSSLRVRLRSAEAGKAVIFAVDEGVLQLTRFTTPSPLFSLLEDRALGVRTLQAFDLLMPDHAQLAGRIPAFGGGMDEGGGSARFQNPFRRRGEPPLAAWSSLIDVTPQGTDVDIPVPAYYNGRIRIMAVGSSPARVGSTSCASTVKAPLVLTPQVPLTVSPGDIFDGALVLANTESRPVRAEISCESDKALVFLKPLPQFAELAADSELVLPFRMRAGEAPGAADLHFTVQGEGRSYVRSASLSVRPSSPLRTSLQAGTAEGPLSIAADRAVFTHSAHSEASLSPLPLPLVRGLAGYLSAYPYDCTEQLISRAFAQILMRPYPGLSREKERDEAISAAVDALRARISWNGVSLWPGGQPDPLLTVYAADFLLTMRESGLGSDDGLLDQVCSAVERICPLNRSSLADARTSAYGIWVLTREGRITTQLIENLKDALRERGIQGWKKDVTAVLIAASQRQMHIRRTLAFGSIEYAADGWFDELAQKALHMSLLARYFPEQCTDERRLELFESTVMAMQASRYATFSAAQSSRALLALGSASAFDMGQVSLACSDGEGQTEAALQADGALLSAEAPICRNWKLDMPQGSPRLYWQVLTAGFDSVPAPSAASHGIEVSRVYLDSSGNAVSSVRQGEEVTVKITARAMKPRIEDCAISDLLPGGFEMVLPRGESEGSLPENVTFADRREDRMILFADLTDQELVYTYRIRAVNRGSFTVPPIHAEAMYDQSLYGHSAAGNMEIH